MSASYGGGQRSSSSATTIFMSSAWFSVGVGGRGRSLSFVVVVVGFCLLVCGREGLYLLCFASFCSQEPHLTYCNGHRFADHILVFHFVGCKSCFFNYISYCSTKTQHVK